mgnify:FL=1
MQQALLKMIDQDAVNVLRHCLIFSFLNDIARLMNWSISLKDSDSIILIIALNPTQKKLRKSINTLLCSKTILSGFLHSNYRI